MKNLQQEVNLKKIEEEEIKRFDGKENETSIYAILDLMKVLQVLLSRIDRQLADT